MEKAQHTPGPWLIIGERDQDDLGVIPAGRAGSICSISSTFGFGAADEANARLIAAAPFLLEAAKEAERFLREWAEFCGDEIPYPLPMLQAAIAKAEQGGSKG